MEGGSNIAGDQSGGTSPVPAGCRHRNSGPPKLGGDGGGDRNCFWRKGFWNQGFRDASKNKGQGGQPGGPPGVQAPPWRGQTLGRATRAPGPLVVALWLHSGSSGRFFCADFLSDFSRIFGALFIWGKTEIEKQQKTGTGTVVH